MRHGHDLNTDKRTPEEWRSHLVMAHGFGSDLVPGFSDPEARHLQDHQNQDRVDADMRSGRDRREMVNHPDHYGGADDPYEVIKVLEAWGVVNDAYIFNVIKYLARAGKKGDRLEDLKKAKWYLDRRIATLENPDG